MLLTYSLSRTRTSGVTNPRPSTKLSILATRVSKPPNMNTPPKMVEPRYPAGNIIIGLPPSTSVAPPRYGSMVTDNIVPPVRMA